MIKNVTVIIPNYNGSKYLCNCLRTLIAGNKELQNIIVVDNGSTDGSIEAAKDLYPDIQYLLLDQNYGFAKARLPEHLMSYY